jgi:hypothetical protein
MAKGERYSFLGAYIRNPLPDEDALYSDNNIRFVRLDSFDKGFWIRIHVTVKDNFSIRTDDADIHYPGVKFDAAVILVCIGIKPHWVSSFGYRLPSSAYKAVCRRGRPQ